MTGTTRMRRHTSSRSGMYSTMVGLALGALLAGLFVPFAVGDDDGGVATTSLAQPGLPDGDRSGPRADGAANDTDAGDARDSLTPADAAASTASTAVTGSGQATADAANTPDGVTRLASDRGITPTTIKVGFVMLDFTTANALGLAPAHYELETQRKAYQAHVDAINTAGGIHGRRIETAYVIADPFQRESAIAACNQLIQDEKVFMVGAFAGFTAEAMLCVGQQHKTPIVVFGTPPNEHFEATEGRLVSDGMATTRLMFNWVNELDRLGVLKGKKIGIVGDENTATGDKQAVEQGLLPALETFGYKVTHRTRLSEDLHTAASQTPVEVQRMRTAGVDTVMLSTNFLNATQWVRAAEGQGWRPQYLVSDLQGLTCDVCVEDMPDSFHGAIGITDRHFVRGAREGMPEPEVDRGCRETYNRATGEKWKYGDRHPLYNTCMQVEMIERTLVAAGVNPTRPSWTAGVGTVGDFPLATTFGGGFSGRNDYTNTVVTIRWDTNCPDSPRTGDTERACYRTVDQPRGARY